MPKRRTLTLSDAQYAELQQAVRSHPKAYIRERAAALLKIAHGHSPHQVARTGVLRPRSPDVVYTWLNRYETKGFAGLVMRPGRGRKPAFSPSICDCSGGAACGPAGASSRSPCPGL